MTAESPQPTQHHSPWEVFRVALKLGCISFGGPIAHLGYFRNEYVLNRKWVDDAEYADLVALCQFLPGPASSQVGIAVGTIRAGIKGGILAWLGFTLPSAIIMTALALAFDRFDLLDAGWVSGLMVVAVAVVAQAVYGMGRQFCQDWTRMAIAAIATLISIAYTSPITHVSIILGAAVVGHFLLKPSTAPAPRPARSSVISRKSGFVCVAIWIGLLIALPILATSTGSQALAMVNTFFRVGSLVFGGGHTILPLLEHDIVGGTWMTAQEFLAGYGAAQAVPGPLLTFSAYLGAQRSQSPNGVAGAALAIGAIFLPSFLLVFGSLPFWQAIRSNQAVRTALAGINAAVVGILLAALWSPVISEGIDDFADVVLAVVCFGLLLVWKRPAWQVVAFGAIAGQLIAAVT